MTLLVKICGLTDAAAVTTAIDSGADAIGFVFAASARRIGVSRATAISAGVPATVKRVAVMMHPSVDEWEVVRDEFRPDVLQTDLRDFDYLDVPPDMEKWPVLRQGEIADEEALPESFVYEGKLSGSGQIVDWNTAAKLASRSRIILAGGLNVDNVTEAITSVAPFGVDVSSGVESSPGKKDCDKIRAFISAVRNATGGI